jgi:uncharacterized protein (TIGR00255 family)
MTGFGKSQVELPGKQVTIEIKCLNSKQLDLSLRLPNIFRDREANMRSTLSQKLERGKIEMSMSFENMGTEANYTLNKDVMLDYYRQLKDIVSGIPEESGTELIPLLVRMPDVMKTEKDEPGEEEWNKILQAVSESIDQVVAFRAEEGKTLEKDIRLRIKSIMELLEQVEPFEQERVNHLKKKIVSQVNEVFSQGDYDENRLEQEMIYYLEKLDITEEKVRLKKHCEYFLDTMKEDNAVGKKLGFISQEIGREINTLGSKANDVNIQKIVILMKDELEKVKEQLYNIL